MTRDDIIRMAREAGVTDGIELPAEVAAVERFAALVAAHAHASRPPAMVVKTTDIDPALLRDMLAKAPAMPILPAPAEPTPEAIAAAVADEREACARVCDVLLGQGDEGYQPDAADCAAAIRARGAA